ncbi:hypothetical protein F4678DRAFT_431198 [Xylaria arbuscula]|nr:hypothetical protein F4678DRAFT_431198 [Xylaria arbuscula]
MDQQSSACSELMDCPLARALAADEDTLYFTCYDNQDRLVGYGFGRGTFRRHQGCDKCFSKVIEPPGIEIGRRLSWLGSLQRLEDWALDDDNCDGDNLCINNAGSTHDSQDKPSVRIAASGNNPLRSIYDLGMPKQPSRDATVLADIKGEIVRAFREEYIKVVHNIHDGAIRSCFQKFRSAWKCGIDTLREFCNGESTDSVGSVVAMLCVCSAMSRTIDANNTRAKRYDHQDTYSGHFNNDLQWWGLLFKNMPCNLRSFIIAVKALWDVDIDERIGGEAFNYLYSIDPAHPYLDTLPPFDCRNVDPAYPYLENLAQRLVLDFDAMLDRTNDEETLSEEAQGPSRTQQTQQIDQPQQFSKYSSSVHHIWPHRLKDMDEKLRAFLVTSAAFLILFIFLTWLCAIMAGRSISEASEILIGSDHLFTRPEGDMANVPLRVRRADKALTNLFEEYGEANDLMVPQQSQTPNTAQEPSQVSVNGKFSCGESGCSKTFANQQNLTRHKRDIHNPNQDCERCGKSYTYRGLRSHKCAHKEPSGPPLKRRKTSGSTCDGG